MSEPNQFRHYLIVQDAEGSNVELARTAEQVAVLAFDTARLEFAHCHVLLQPLADRQGFDEACDRLRKNGHPLLARLIEHGEDEGNPFYITSNVDGESLRAYLGRQQEIPMWLAVMLACRSLEAGMALCERGDFLTDQPMDCFRIVQTGPQAVQVIASDYRLLDAKAMKNRALKSGFDRQGKFLRSFLQEQGGGPTAADTMLPAVDFGELLGGCLTTLSSAVAVPARELRNALLKFAPEHLSGEIPTAQKPRALVAPLLASYQEVARGVVNLVRIQSQRLDMANPYSMKGTLARTGRQVWVEQVPPRRVCGSAIEDACRLSLKLAKKRDSNSLVSLALVNESDGVTCMAEETVEGISLAELLRERRSLEPQEAYLLLAGLDTAFAQIEKAGLPARKLRLEDVFLLTGFGREDPRTASLLSTKLNEWPTFTVMARAHPCLASMSGRGTDPGVLLPSQVSLSGKAPSPWAAGWMAAAGRFVLGMEPVGGRGDPDPIGRDKEAVARMLDDEIARARDGVVSSRGDFLARYARIIHHYDLVKPIGSETAAAASPPRNKGKASGPLKPAARKKTEPEPQPVAGAEEQPVQFGGMLAAGFAPAAGAEKTAGFAELLFQSKATQAAGSALPDTNWGGPAEEELNWMPEGERVPLWLKAAVFLGGSMVAGGILAHLSGHAFWQEIRVRKALPLTSPYEPGTQTPTREAAAAIDVPVPPPVEMPKLPPASAAELPAPGLTLKPPSGAVMRKLLDEPSPPPPVSR